MKIEDAEEYTQALGQKVSGVLLQIAIAYKLGVPEALGLTTAQWVEYMLVRNDKSGVHERKDWNET